MSVLMLFGKSILLLVTFFILEEILGFVLPALFEMLQLAEIVPFIFRVLPEIILNLALSALITVAIEIQIIQNFIEEQFNKTRITLYILVVLRQIIGFLFIAYIVF